jgi:hypothetical protein
MTCSACELDILECHCSHHPFTRQRGCSLCVPPRPVRTTTPCAYHHALCVPPRPVFPLCSLALPPTPLILCSAEPTFDVDAAVLERRYKLLQWQLHPDKAVGRSFEEQRFSAEQAALVNQAYGVLRSPLPRANYLVGRCSRFAGGGGGGGVPSCHAPVCSVRMAAAMSPTACTVCHVTNCMPHASFAAAHACRRNAAGRGAHNRRPRATHGGVVRLCVCSALALAASRKGEGRGL